MLDPFFGDIGLGIVANPSDPRQLHRIDESVVACPEVTAFDLRRSDVIHIVRFGAVVTFGQLPSDKM